MKTKSLLFFFLFLLQNNAFAQANMITLNGEEYYINGVNMPWNNFGWDFGKHDSWGSGYDSTWFEAAFTELEADGVNCIRMWIHCDGRANPEFDENGFVTGLDEGMLEELEDFVSRANDHSLMVVITLWSHDMLEDNTGIAGPDAGLHSDLIKDAEKTNSYFEKALIPIVERLNSHCNILAWEIMNEPEWGMEIGIGDATFQTVGAEEMQRFMARCIQVIRAHSNQNITVGSAIPFGNANGQNKNYWSESEFQRLGFDCSEVFLDFYSFHFYDWMDDSESPFENNAQHWQLGKPILLAEIPTIPEETDEPLDRLNTCLEKEYAGMLFWSYNAEDEYSDWENCKAEISDFGNGQPYVVYNNSCDSIFVEKPLLVCNIYPNPVSDFLNFPVHFPDESLTMEVDIINAQGGLVSVFQLPYNTQQIDLRKLPAGFYFIHLKIIDEGKQLLQSASYSLVIV